MKSMQTTVSVLLALFLVFVFGELKAYASTITPGDTTYLDLTFCETACPLPSPLSCTSGTYVEVLTGSDGCDSLIIIELTIIPTLYELVALCEGDCIDIPEIDSTFCPLFSGDYYFEYNGCEEGLIYNVSLSSDVIISDVFISTCEPGECFVIDFLGDTICPISDTTVQVPFGYCDQFFSIIIDVSQPSPIDSFVFYSCPGECIEWDGGVFCKDYSSLNTYTLPSTGCDSTVYFEANFYTGTNGPIYLGICENECITWNSVEYCDPINITDSLTTSNGCDSIVNIMMEAIPLLPQFMPNDTLIDIGAKLDFNISLNNFTVFWNAGLEGPKYTFDSDDFGAGIHPVFATIVENSTGCLRVTDTTLVEVFDPTSLVLNLENEGLTVYPNPISADSFIQLSVPENLLGKTLKVIIHNVTGAQLFSSQVRDLQTQNAIDLPNGITPGIYMLELQLEGEKFTQKIVVQ